MSHDFSEKYNKTIERLWERLEYHRDIIDTSCISRPTSPSPWGELKEENPFVNRLLEQVQEEFNYRMSNTQCSCAVMFFLNADMDRYNEGNDLDLHPRGPETVEPEGGTEK